MAHCVGVLDDERLSRLYKTDVWFKTAPLVIENNFLVFCGGQIGMHFDSLVSHEHNDVGDALVGADGQLFAYEFVLATDFNIFVGLEFTGHRGLACVGESALHAAPLIGAHRQGDECQQSNPEWEHTCD